MYSIANGAQDNVARDDRAEDDRAGDDRAPDDGVWDDRAGDDRAPDDGVWDEAARVAALVRYGILDTPREQDFDDLAQIASDVCGTPIAVVNLVAADRQWFKAEVGLGVRETPLETSFCGHAILAADFMMVPDATKDARFKSNPLVAGEPGLRFYAGAILRTPDGLPIGTVCVLDYEPRDLDEHQVRTLKLLARQAMTQLELRRSIVEHQNALRRVGDAEARHRQILESAIDYAIISIDLDGLVTSWSAGARNVFGWTEEEMLGRPASLFFTLADRQHAVPQAEMQAALERGRGTDERWHLRKDGKTFWANGEMMPLKDAAGVILGFIKIVRDRTAQRLAAESQRADSEFMRSVLASSSDCIKVLDLEANLVFMSEGGKRVMEVSDFNAIKGCPWPDFWQGQGNADAIAAVEAARAGGTGEFQGAADTHAGTPKYWDVRVTPIPGPDGQPEKILAISRDITATRRVEAALSERERQLRMALTAGRLGYWELDVAAGTLTASDICKVNFGRDPADPFTYDELRAAVHPADRDRMTKAVEHTLATGDDYDIEYRAIRPGGSLAWILVRAQLLRDEEGRPARMSGISLDVTDLKAVEQKLELSEASLKLATDAAEIGSWDLDLTTNVLTWSDRTKALFGISPGVPCSMDDFYEGLHPDDRAATSIAFASALDPSVRATYDVEYRTVGKEDGLVRWVAAKGRGIFDEDARCVRAIGTAIGIGERKEAEERQRVLSHELNHRMKNTLTMIQAIANQTLRAGVSLEDAKVAFGARVAALSKAQDILTATSWSQASVLEVVQNALSPHGGDGSRFTIAGPDLHLSARCALGLSLALHELATNAAKYGALSTDAGFVQVTWRTTTDGTAPEFMFGWREQGGPPVTPPTRTGFGTRMIERFLAGYFRGTAQLSYETDGVSFSLNARSPSC